VKFQNHQQLSSANHVTTLDLALARRLMIKASAAHWRQIKGHS